MQGIEKFKRSMGTFCGSSVHNYLGSPGDQNFWECKGLKYSGFKGSKIFEGPGDQNFWESKGSKCSGAPGIEKIRWFREKFFVQRVKIFRGLWNRNILGVQRIKIFGSTSGGMWG